MVQVHIRMKLDMKQETIFPPSLQVIHETDHNIFFHIFFCKKGIIDIYFEGSIQL